MGTKCDLLIEQLLIGEHYCMPNAEKYIYSDRITDVLNDTEIHVVTIQRILLHQLLTKKRNYVNRTIHDDISNGCEQILQCRMVTKTIRNSSNLHRVER